MAEKDLVWHFHDKVKNCCKIAGRNEQTPVTGVGGIDVTNIHPVLSTLPEPDQAINIFQGLCILCK